VLLLALGSNCKRVDSPVEMPLFVDVTQGAGVERTTPTYDAAIGDFDGDALPDIYVGNHGAGAVLMHNLGEGHFADVLAASGIDPRGDQHGSAGGTTTTTDAPTSSSRSCRARPRDQAESALQRRPGPFPRRRRESASPIRTVVRARWRGSMATAMAG
jgi:hypothetical protein